MDARLNQNQTVLRVLVATVALEMLADRNSLLNKVVEILRDLRGET